LRAAGCQCKHRQEAIMELVLVSSDPPRSSGPPDSGIRLVPRSAGERIRVLVVDDYEDVRRLYAGALEEAGYDVSEAADGDAAVELSARMDPTVILIDMWMPNTDGWEATRRIRATEQGRRVHIIALTAAAGDDSRRLAFEAGCDAFIAKPCTPDVVVAAVEAAVQREQTH
jgi:two-component system, cell cycle response regulator DivK